MTLLSEKDIKKYHEKGIIVIDPFREEQINNCSYDLTLGHYYFRPKAGMGETLRGNDPFFDTKDWYELHDAHKTRSEIILKPGDFILAHTREFAGTVADRKLGINSEVRGTSTMCGLGVNVNLGAGWGDVGWVNRWRIGLKNESVQKVVLPVGTVICQIIFHACAPVDRDYTKIGRYQGAEARLAWEPWGMLPKGLKVWP